MLPTTSLRASEPARVFPLPTFILWRVVDVILAGIPCITLHKMGEVA
jgi:hypothetical protein